MKVKLSVWLAVSFILYLSSPPAFAVDKVIYEARYSHHRIPLLPRVSEEEREWEAKKIANESGLYAQMLCDETDEEFFLFDFARLLLRCLTNLNNCLPRPEGMDTRNTRRP